jgi:hypothetical protein
MDELTEREKLLEEQRGLEELIEGHREEIDDLNATVEDIRKLVANFDAGLDANPWETFKVLYEIDQDNDWE